MASTKAFVGKPPRDGEVAEPISRQLFESIVRLSDWVVRNNYKGYDTFDGLNSWLLRPLTLETKLLRTVLQQGVRRSPLNLRPIIGIPKGYSSKGMGFLARGYIRLYQCTGEEAWRRQAEFALQWLIEHQSEGFHGSSWGNHFDYQSRAFYLPTGVPTVVWTSLIGHAFLDAYDEFHKELYLQIATSACEHILKELNVYPDGDGACISYVPGLNSQVHNANTLAGSLLARTYSHNSRPEFLELARRAIQYTAQHQRPNGSWWYGELNNLHWVDNFHTGYVLDCFKLYELGAGDKSFDGPMMTGYRYWKDTFFLTDGTPKYYDTKVLPLDIQCCSQAIDTFVLFADRDSEALTLATRVAQWTIKNMQDQSGYFYYRRYSKWLVNKTATLHWGQATMLCALAGLYKALSKEALDG
jgi:hypothetical protein